MHRKTLVAAKLIQFETFFVAIPTRKYALKKISGSLTDSIGNVYCCNSYAELSNMIVSGNQTDTICNVSVCNSYAIKCTEKRGS